MKDFDLQPAEPNDISAKLSSLSLMLDNAERWLAQHGWTGQYGTQPDLDRARETLRQLEREWIGEDPTGPLHPLVERAFKCPVCGHAKWNHLKTGCDRLGCECKETHAE